MPTSPFHGGSGGGGIPMPTREPPVRASAASIRPSIIEESQGDQYVRIIQEQEQRLKKLEAVLQAQGIDIDSMDEEMISHQKQLASVRQALAKNDTVRYLELLLDAMTHGEGSAVLPSVEIRYHNLNVDLTYEEGHQAPPSVLSFFVNLCKSCIPGAKRMTTKHLIDNASGVLKPGTLTLMLGPPGAGKTTLMKALSGHSSGDLDVSGDVLYNDLTKDAPNFFVNKLIDYTDQIDKHIPTLTVKETFQFAFDSLVGTENMPIGMQDVSGVSDKVDTIIKFLGLDICKDTIIGNDMLRGVSGGQRKRVTTGELLCGMSLGHLMDEISTGLDAATTFDIITMLRGVVKTFNHTTVISLLQPAPEVFDLFDDVMLLDNGCVLYHGPREGIIPHFESLGYRCPPRKDVADYLQEVTTQAGSVYLMDGEERAARGCPEPPPSSTEDFVAAWKANQLYKDMEATLLAPPPKPKVPLSKMYTQEFSNTWCQSFMLCLARQWTLTMRDPNQTVAKVGQAVVLGSLLAILFNNSDLDEYMSKLSLLYIALVQASTSAFGTFSDSFDLKSVFYKQRDSGFFRTTSYAMAKVIVELPFQILEVLIFGTIVYWSTGLCEESEEFLFFMFVLFSVSFSMTQFFALLTALMPNFSVGMNIGALSFLLFMLFSGFIQSPDELPSYWKWFYYVDPLGWGFLAFAQNEFKSSDYDVAHTTPYGTVVPNYGDYILESYGLSTNGDRRWLALPIFYCYFVFFFLCSALAFHYIRTTEPHEAPTEHVEADFGEPAQDIVPGRPSTTATGMQFIPATLCFKNLSYAVDLPQRQADGTHETLELLHEISGFALPSRCMALMGSSGAGKTTLLDVLAGRKTAGHITGQIFVNGYELDKVSFGRAVGYCEQTDIHNPNTTVREALLFSSKMRLSDDTPEESRLAFVREIIQLLDLHEIENKLVGRASIEQAKRVTIGVEMVANPAVLFLDEPTSGLDARAALTVISAIKRAAASGRTIVCTIHQPSAFIFESFDSMLLLKRGGRTIYFGDLGAGSCNLINHLESIPGSPKIRDGQNPAVYMLDVIGAGTGQGLAVDPAEFWLASGPRVIMNDHLERPGMSVPGEAVKLEYSREFALTYCGQVVVLMDRAFTSYWRSPDYNAVRMIVAVVFALLFGSVFPNTDVDDISKATSMVTLIFVAMFFTGFLCFSTVLPVLSVDRAVFYREKAAKMYDPFMYNIAVGVVEIPYLIVMSLLFVTPFYLIVGFTATTAKFAWFWIFAYGFMAWATYFGQLMVALMPNKLLSMVAGFAIINISCNLFGGFMQTPSEIPGALEFMWWISPMHYCYEGLLVTQFEGDHSVLEDVGETMEQYVYSTWTDFDYDHRWYDLFVLAGFCSFTRIVTGIVLAKVSHLNR